MKKPLLNILVIASILFLGSCSEGESGNIKIYASESYGTVWVTNLSSVTWYDVKINITSVDSKGKSYRMEEEFVGKWTPEGQESFKPYGGSEKYEIIISSNQGGRSFTIYEFPYESE